MKLSKRQLQAQKEREESEIRRKACSVPFTEEEWHTWENPDDEIYTIDLIKKYLRTDAQKSWLSVEDLTISDILSGRFNENQEPIVQSFFDDWNNKLGSKHFGF